MTHTVTFFILACICGLTQLTFLPLSSLGAEHPLSATRGREEGGLGDLEGAWDRGPSAMGSDSQSASLFPFALDTARGLIGSDTQNHSPLQPKSQTDSWDTIQPVPGLMPHELTMEMLPLELETLLTRSKECSSEIDEVIEKDEELVPISHSTKLAMLRANPFFAEEDTRPEYLAVLAPLMHLFRARNGTELLKRHSPASLIVVENGTLFVDVAPDFFFRLTRGKAFGALTVLYRTHASARVLSQSESYYFKANGRSLRSLLRSSSQLLDYMEEKFAIIALRQMKKRPVVLIPGFASTQLVAWQHKRCMTGDISIGDRVWVNLEKVLNNYITGPSCWLNCMLLDTVDQTDPSDCKIRPDIGLSAIYDLSPGVLSEVTTIFKTLAYVLAQRCGYDSSNIIPLPYDWRLAPSKLESRDLFFTKMKLQIEFAVKQNDNPAVVIAHSLGNNIFLYFTKWLQFHFPETHEDWLLKHIYQYLAIGPPLLGATEPIRALLSGVDFGMPMRQADARTLAQSFSSSLWMVAIAPQFNPSAQINRNDAESCDQEILAAPAQWPSPIIHIRASNGSEFGYTVQDVGSGRFFEDLYEFTGDDIWLRILSSLKKYYLEDKVWRYFGPSGPERPKVRKVLLQYGINVPTVMGLWYSIKGQSAELNSIEYETSSGKLVEENLRSAYFFRSSRTPGDPSRQRYNRAGDGTVPYASLSWAHTWHLGTVRRKDFAARLHSEFATFPHTRYSSSMIQNGMVFETVVNEIEGMAHRGAVRNKFAIRLAEREFLSQLKTDLAWAVTQMERMENEGRSIEAAFNATLGGAATETLARSVRSNGRKDSKLKTDNGNTLCFEPNIQFPYPRSNL